MGRPRCPFGPEPVTRAEGQLCGVQGRTTEPLALVPSVNTASPWASRWPSGHLASQEAVLLALVVEFFVDQSG